MDIRKNSVLVLPGGERIRILDIVNCYKSVKFRDILDGEDEHIYALRKLREQICFPVVDRGKLWYNELSTEQYSELRNWREKWLNVTNTLVIPETPSWINSKLEGDIIL